MQRRVLELVVVVETIVVIESGQIAANCTAIDCSNEIQGNGNGEKSYYIFARLSTGVSQVARKLSVGSLSADGRSHHTNGLVLTKVLLDYHDKQQQKSQDQAEADVHSNARVLATALQDKRKKKRRDSN